MSVDSLWEQFAQRTAGAGEDAAPAKLKARLYSKLIDAEQESGPLLGLTETRAGGHELCVFERLVEILPQPALQSYQFCNICHARVAAERLEHPPIFWPHCPYCDFQKA